MSSFAWNRTLLIANPAAQSGRGAQGTRDVERTLRGRPAGQNAPTELEVLLTEGPGHAVEIAARRGGSYDTVVTLGGDGIIHEVVNGLMRIPAGQRPCLAVVPLGSGNDFARTLGMPRNHPDRALDAIAGGVRQWFDLGCANGTYFMQTLSFGLDAAIALATMERRTKNGAHGTRLFAATGFDVLSHNRKPFAYRAELEVVDADGTIRVERIDGEEIVFAVQVGPTYGGGFRICPKASPTDGLLDVCRSVKLPSTPHTLALFSLARLGLHVRSSVVRFARVRRLDIEFEREVPCQVDGERLDGIDGTRFGVTSVPAALEVVCGR